MGTYVYLGGSCKKIWTTYGLDVRYRTWQLSPCDILLDSMHDRDGMLRSGWAVKVGKMGASGGWGYVGGEVVVGSEKEGGKPGRAGQAQGRPRLWFSDL